MVKQEAPEKMESRTSDLPFGTHFPSHLNSSVEQTDVCRPTPVGAECSCLHCGFINGIIIGESVAQC